MSDYIFIVPQPFNGFPFVPKKSDFYPTAHAWTLTRAEAMRFYWFSEITDIRVNIYIDINETGYSSNTIHLHLKSLEISFMGRDFPSSTSNRVVFEPCETMYKFYETEDNAIESTNLFTFSITPPIYIDEDVYEIRFYGEYKIDYGDDSFLLRLGYDSIEGESKASFSFNLSIFEKEIPCILAHVSGKDYTESQLTLNATTTIDDSWTGGA